MDTDLDDKAAYDEDYKSTATSTTKKDPQTPIHTYPYDADWSDFSKLENWQYELLAAYNPSESSGDEEIKELMRLSKDNVNLYLKRSKLRKWIPLPKIEHDRTRHEGKRDHKRLFNAFVNLKLAEVEPESKEKHPKPQRLVGALMREVRDAHIDRQSPDEDEGHRENKNVSIAEEDHCDDDHSSDMDSMENDLKFNKPIDPSTINPGSDSDDPNHERSFNTDKDQAEIDEVFARNHFKLYSTARVLRDGEVVKSFHVPPDVSPIQVCPSLKDLKDTTLSKRKRDYYLHRVAYVFGFVKRTSDPVSFTKDFGYLYNTYVNDQNEYYDSNYKLTGILIFYQQGFGVAMVEGSELEIMTHFYGLRGTELLKLMDRPKILYIQGHTKDRFMKKFSFCTANPPFTLSDKKCKRTGLKVVKCIHRKVKKCCHMLRIKGMTDNSGIYQLPFYFTNILPTLNEIEFCLNYSKLRNLDDFVSSVDKIPDVSDSSDEGWPPIDEAVPYNIWSGVERHCNLEREKAKAKSMAAKARKLDLLRFARASGDSITTIEQKQEGVQSRKSKLSRKSRRSVRSTRHMSRTSEDYRERSESIRSRSTRYSTDLAKSKLPSESLKRPHSILKH